MSIYNCCRRKMESTTYTQPPTKEWLSREITLFICSHCGKMKIHKDYIDKKGEKWTRNIIVNELAQAEWEEIKEEAKEKFTETHPQKNDLCHGITTVKETETEIITIDRSYFVGSGKRDLSRETVRRAEKIAI